MIFRSILELFINEFSTALPMSDFYVSDSCDGRKDGDGASWITWKSDTIDTIFIYRVETCSCCIIRLEHSMVLLCLYLVTLSSLFRVNFEKYLDEVITFDVTRWGVTT